MKKIFLLLTLFIPVIFVNGQQLDSGFGVNGIVSTNYSGIEEVYNTVDVQSDGKIVSAGYAKNSLGIREGIISRYNSNGTLDNSFSNGGKLIVAATKNEDIKKILVQPDGKIVSVGTRNVSSTEAAMVIMRFMPNGAIDNSFGSSGTAIFSINGASCVANNLVLQNDGKIIVAGTKDYDKYILARYNVDGTSDNTFGSSGSVLSSYEPSLNTASEGIGLALQPDGKILISGGLWGSSPLFGVARYNVDGTVDNNFGVSGRQIITSPNAPSYPEIWGGQSIAIDMHGNIYMSGEYNNKFAAKEPLVVCLDKDGKINKKFGAVGYGIWAKSSFFEVIPNLVIDGSGTILGVGKVQSSNGDSVVMLRMNTDGSLNTSFGILGRFLLGSNNASYTTKDVSIQNDGKIVLAGFNNYNNKKKTTLMRIGYPNSTNVGTIKVCSDEVKLYPNPAYDVLTVSCPDEWHNRKLSVTVINQAGQVVRKEELNKTNYKLDISTLNNGCYWLSIYDGKTSIWEQSFIHY